MIKDTVTQDLSITVRLKSGEIFENKDMTSAPMGEHGRWVSFWHDGKIRAYPYHDVEYYELIPNE